MDDLRARLERAEANVAEKRNELWGAAVLAVEAHMAMIQAKSLPGDQGYARALDRLCATAKAWTNAYRQASRLRKRIRDTEA